MALPSGYTKLEYIESTGTQYIDTGFVPSSTTSVIIDFNSSVSSGVIIGQDSGYKVKGFMLAMTVVVFDSTKKNLSISANNRHVVQLDPKNFKIDNGASSVIDTRTFNGAYPLFLFGNNRAGSFSEGISMRLYACQIYNSTAVEFDFVPCKTSAGAVGLWDNVSNKFYSNAGVGSFKAGPSSVDLTAHKTLVGGTAYTVKGGKCMVNGTVYNILKGRTLIDGTGWDIKFQNGYTWVINDDSALLDSLTNVKADIKFVSNGESFDGLVCSQDRRYSVISYVTGATKKRVWDSDGGWAGVSSQAYRTITFDEEPSGDLLTWLQANATPQ